MHDLRVGRQELSHSSSPSSCGIKKNDVKKEEPHMKSVPTRIHRWHYCKFAEFRFSVGALQMGVSRELLEFAL